MRDGTHAQRASTSTRISSPAHTSSACRAWFPCTTSLQRSAAWKSSRALIPRTKSNPSLSGTVMSLGNTPTTFSLSLVMTLDKGRDTSWRRRQAISSYGIPAQFTEDESDRPVRRVLRSRTCRHILLDWR